MYACWRATGTGAVLYFFLVIVFGMFVLLNLFLAILLSNFSSKADERRRTEKAVEDASKTIVGMTSPQSHDSLIDLAYPRSGGDNNGDFFDDEDEEKEKEGSAVASHQLLFSDEEPSEDPPELMLLEPQPPLSQHHHYQQHQHSNGDEAPIRGPEIGTAAEGEGAVGERGGRGAEGGGRGGRGGRGGKKVRSFSSKAQKAKQRWQSGGAQPIVAGHVLVERRLLRESFTTPSPKVDLEQRSR